MQTIRLLCLLLLLGFMARQTYQAPISEPSSSMPGDLAPRSSSASTSKERSQALQSTGRTPGAYQVHQSQSSNQKPTSTTTPVLDNLALPMNISPSAHADVVSKVVEDLHSLGQACLEYRKSRGEFPPSLAALKTMKAIHRNRRVNIRHGYRFTYTRPHSADSFTVKADPFAAQLRSMPRFRIDESQVIKGQQAERTKRS